MMINRKKPRKSLNKANPVYQKGIGQASLSPIDDNAKERLSIPFGIDYSGFDDRVYDAVVERDMRLGFMSRIDKRTWHGKRITDVFLSIVNDNGGGDQLSTIQMFFARQIAHLIIMCEDMTIRRLTEVTAQEDGSKPPKGDDYRLANHLITLKTLVQLAKQVGIKRMPKEINPRELPTLHTYVAGRDS